MIRFIDLRGQMFNDDDLPKSEQATIFAFYDTITDRFMLDGQTWVSAEHFRANAAGRLPQDWLIRCLAALPDWALKDSP